MTPEQILERAGVWFEVGAREPLFTPAHDAGENYAAVREIVLGGSLSWAGVHQRYKPKPGDFVMDVGANCGIYSAYCAVKGAKVVAYEPFWEPYQKLAKMALDTHLYSEALRPINAAIWTYSGVCPYFGNISTLEGAVAYNGGIPSPELQPNELASATHISCCSFADALGHREWDCVKMDIEGSECEVILATPDQALQRIKFMYVEFHPWVSRERYELTTEKLERNFHFEGDCPNQDGRFEAAYLTRRDGAT